MKATVVLIPAFLAACLFLAAGSTPVPAGSSRGTSGVAQHGNSGPGRRYKLVDPNTLNHSDEEQWVTDGESPNDPKVTANFGEPEPHPPQTHILEGSSHVSAHVADTHTLSTGSIDANTIHGTLNPESGGQLPVQKSGGTPPRRSAWLVRANPRLRSAPVDSSEVDPPRRESDLKNQKTTEMGLFGPPTRPGSPNEKLTSGQNELAKPEVTNTESNGRSESASH
ncbi:hypothetical protein H0H93_005885 [Arthromyces matolae]|nr:hypothetical protein H0H93_005885 [Arthromyces matolae]